LLGIILLFAGYWYGFSPNGRFDLSLAILLLAIAVVGGGVWKAKPASMVAESITVIYMGLLTATTLLVADTFYTYSKATLSLILLIKWLQSNKLTTFLTITLVCCCIWTYCTILKFLL